VTGHVVRSHVGSVARGVPDVVRVREARAGSAAVFGILDGLGRRVAEQARHREVEGVSRVDDHLLQGAADELVSSSCVRLP
jgi:hypothetical protein